MILSDLRWQDIVAVETKLAHIGAPYPTLPPALFQHAKVTQHAMRESRLVGLDTLIFLR